MHDGFAVVTIGWIAMVVFSALPFYFSGTLNYTNPNIGIEIINDLTPKTWKNKIF